VDAGKDQVSKGLPSTLKYTTSDQPDR
jgi:hypothetical protein